MYGSEAWSSVTYSGEFSIHLGKMGMRRVPCHRVSMRSEKNDI